MPLDQADGIGPLDRREVELLPEGIDPGHDDFEFVAGFEGFLLFPTDETLATEVMPPSTKAAT